MLDTVELTVDQWAVCIAVGALIIVVAEVKKLLKIQTSEAPALVVASAGGRLTGRLIMITDELADPVIGDSDLANDGVSVSTLRAVGPGFDDGVRSGPDVALEAVEHLVIARTPEVAGGDLWADAGRKILRFHLARMLAHVSTAIAGEDPEAVHDMRVAARRVRAAWRVFGDAYDREVVRDRVRELRTLGDRLGAVRDLDVQLAIVSAHRDRRSKRERAALAPLLEAWTAERTGRHGDLAAHLAIGLVRDGRGESRSVRYGRQR